MRLSQRGGGQSDILQAHLMNFFHHHVDDQVTLAEMMMETDSHPVMGMTFYQRFVNVLDQFAVFIVHHGADDRPHPAEGYAVLIMITLEGLFARCF